MRCTRRIRKLIEISWIFLLLCQHTMKSLFVFLDLFLFTSNDLLGILSNYQIRSVIHQQIAFGYFGIMYLVSIYWFLLSVINGLHMNIKISNLYLFWRNSNFTGIKIILNTFIYRTFSIIVTYLKIYFLDSLLASLSKWTNARTEERTRDHIPSLSLSDQN